MNDLRTAATQALEALEGGADSWQLVGPAIDALKAALTEQVQAPVACEPQYANDDGWCDWVCPKPIGYLMQCCGCDLIHEVESRVAKYQPRPSEEFEVVDDPDLQVQWRMKRRDDISPKRKPQQAEPVQEQDIEDAIEAAYWHFDARRSGLNEWASAPQSERDAFKAEARKLARGYFPTRQAQDTKREMLAVADAFIRGKRAALAQERAERVDEYRKGFIAGQIDMRDREQAEPVQEPVAWMDPDNRDFSRVRRVGWTPLYAALAQETQDPELSAALGWPGGISTPVLGRTELLRMVAALMQDKLWEDHRVRHLFDQAQEQAEPVQEPVYKVKVDGVFQDPEPLAAAFRLPDGEHLLYTARPSASR